MGSGSVCLSFRSCCAPRESTARSIGWRTLDHGAQVPCRGRRHCHAYSFRCHPRIGRIPRLSGLRFVARWPSSSLYTLGTLPRPDTHRFGLADDGATHKIDDHCDRRGPRDPGRRRAASRVCDRSDRHRPGTEAHPNGRDQGVARHRSRSRPPAAARSRSAVGPAGITRQLARLDRRSASQS